MTTGEAFAELLARARSAAPDMASGRFRGRLVDGRLVGRKIAAARCHTLTRNEGDTFCWKFLCAILEEPAAYHLASNETSAAFTNAIDVGGGETAARNRRRHEPS